MLFGNIFFGNDAFNKWAEMLEGDFYEMTFGEFNKGFGIWQRYNIYICIIATNIYHFRDMVGRVVRHNPELADSARLLEEQHAVLAGLEEQLKAVEGNFNVSYEVLQNAEKRKTIASVLRKFPIVWGEICGIINGIN